MNDATVPRCACGRPLHYSNPTAQALVQHLIDRRGPDVVVRTPQGAWLVQRHYIALHGLKGADLSALGFPRV